jgi:UDP-N-acetyl-D-galactosamine dehydrogenase
MIKKVTAGSTPEIADAVNQLYGEVIVAGTHRAPSIRVAEAAKVIENTQRDLNIALMNELSVIFNRMSIDTNAVLEAAGTKWNFLPFKPGMVGGHCIGVDPYYLTHKAEELGYNPQVILAGRRINDNMGRYIARNTIRLMLKNGIDVARSTVGIMGITFKENCPDIRNSKVIDVIKELESWNVQVVVSDPWADPDEVRREYGFELSEITSFPRVQALVLAVAHDAVKMLSLTDLRSLCASEKPILIDVKGVFDLGSALNAGFTVFRL